MDQYTIRFIKGIANEDTIFNAECLLRARSLKSIKKSLYTYEPRPDGLMNTNNNIAKIIKNKYDFLNQRRRLGNIYEQLTGKDSLNLYGGSLIMSAIQLGLSLQGQEAYSQYSAYLHIPEVRRAIRMVKLHLRNYKATIIIILLKIKLYRVLFVLFKLTNKLGLKISY